MSVNIKELQKPQIEITKAYLETRKKWLWMSTNNESEIILIKALMSVWEDMSEYLILIWETSFKKKRWELFWW